MFLADDGDVVVRAVHRRAQQIAGAGVQSQVALVDILFVRDVRHQPTVRGGHIPAKLGFDRDIADAVLHEYLFIRLAHARADGLHVRLVLAPACRARPRRPKG